MPLLSFALNFSNPAIPPSSSAVYLQTDGRQTTNKNNNRETASFDQKTDIIITTYENQLIHSSHSRHREMTSRNYNVIHPYIDYVDLTSQKRSRCHLSSEESSLGTSTSMRAAALRHCSSRTNTWLQL